MGAGREEGYGSAAEIPSDAMSNPSGGDANQDKMRDGLYIAVGLGVLSFQRSQIARRKVADAIGDSVNEVEDRVDDVCEQVETLMPQPVAEVMSMTRHMGRLTRARLLGIDPPEPNSDT